MNKIDGFSKYSIDLVNEMLYAEGQENPLEGECSQEQKRKRVRQQRSPAEQQADKVRERVNTGKNSVSSQVRSDAAKKAAITRKRCQGSTTESSKG